MSLPKKVAFLGASITEGFYDLEGGGFVGRFNHWIKAQQPKSKVYNLGIYGENSSQILKRAIPELMPRKPDLVVVQICSNDSARWDDPDNDPKISIVQMEDNFHTLLSQVKLSSQVICLGPPPVDETKTKPFGTSLVYFTNYDLDRYNNKAKEICQSLDIPYIDIFDQWSKMADYQKILEDGLHPNAQGHQMIFELIKAEVEKL